MLFAFAFASGAPQVIGILQGELYAKASTFETIDIAFGIAMLLAAIPIAFSLWRVGENIQITDEHITFCRGKAQIVLPYADLSGIFLVGCAPWTRMVRIEASKRWLDFNGSRREALQLLDAPHQRLVDAKSERR